MTKSKRQLRAEAVERLNDMVLNTGSAIKKLAIALDVKWNPDNAPISMSKLQNRLRDLLTDDDTHESREGYEERMYDVPVSDCPYCGCSRVVIHEYNDMYERPHSYRVEHVDEKEAFNCDCFESYYGFDSIEKAVQHADMREGHVNEHPKQMYVSGEDFEWLQEQLDDGPTNGISDETNGIADEITLPEDDAVAILRKAAKCTSVNTSVGDVLRYNVPGNEPSAWQTSEEACEALADMVERDYVSREVFEDLRDEFTWETTFLHRIGKKCGTKDVPSLVAYVDKLEARVEELESVDRRIAETDSRREAAIRDLERMTAERDKLKRKEKQLSNELGLRDNAIEMLLDVKQELIVERDEWKAKAEQTERAMNKAAGKWARAESRSAKRAEAVERLKSIPPMDTSATRYVRAILGSVAGMTAQDVTRELIDLLTDDDANDAPPKGTFQVSHDCGSTFSPPVKIQVEQDSRDELEVDALTLVDNLRMYGGKYAGDAEVEIIGMLDRQAAITKRDTLHNNPTCSWNSTCAANRPISESADRETPDTTGIGASKDEIRDFDVWSVAYEIYCAGGYVDNGNEPNPQTDGIRELLDRQAAITDSECRSEFDALDEHAQALERENAKLQARVNELEAELCAREKYPDGFMSVNEMRKELGELQAKVDELTAERDYWKREVEMCMKSAYPPSHSPERSYNPDVMAYPDRNGCTTPSTLVSAMIDGLRDERSAQYMALLEELAGIKADLKACQGQLKTERNNFEQATGARDYWREKLSLVLHRLKELGCEVGGINDVPITVELPSDDEGLA